MRHFRTSFPILFLSILFLTACSKEDLPEEVFIPDYSENENLAKNISSYYFIADLELNNVPAEKTNLSSLSNNLSYYGHAKDYPTHSVYYAHATDLNTEEAFQIILSASAPENSFNHAKDESNLFISDSPDEYDGIEINYSHLANGEKELFSTRWVPKSAQKYGEINMLEIETCSTACPIMYADMNIHFSCILYNEAGTKTLEIKNAVGRLIIRK